MRIFFRTDASTVIGTGHVARCLTLARRLRADGAWCGFVCREHAGNLIDYIRQQGFEATGLPLAAPSPGTSNSWDDYQAWFGDDWRNDADATITAIGSEPAEWIVADHYAIDFRWEQRLRPHCRRLMVIDDLANRGHDCDLLLDQNAVTEASARYSGMVSGACLMLLGPRFALLQPQYKDLRAAIRPRSSSACRLLIFFGGADATNLTGLAVSAFLELGRPGLVADVVVDPSHPYLRDLEELARGKKQINMHGRLPTLAPLMMAADMAIGACGATSWERCCLGLPALVVTLAGNQEPIAEELQRLGVIRWVGTKEQVSEEALGQALEEVLAEGDLSAWSRRCLDLVDGWGAERVTETLLISAGPQLHARPAELGDEELLLHWANDSLVRRNAFSPETISSEKHHYWFQERLADDGCRIYILQTPLGLPVGQVRFQRDERDWVITYSIDAALRRRGMGVSLVQGAMSAFAADVGDVPVLARVKTENQASLKVFAALGFTPIATDVTADFQQFRHGGGA